MEPSRLKRDIHPMPDDVGRAIKQAGLVRAYRLRPPYQQNDYIGWIGRAKRPETRAKRLGQMLRELRDGNAYMGMAYRARRAERECGDGE